MPRRKRSIPGMVGWIAYWLTWWLVPPLRRRLERADRDHGWGM